MPLTQQLLQQLPTPQYLLQSWLKRDMQPHLHNQVLDQSPLGIYLDLDSEVQHHGAGMEGTGSYGWDVFYHVSKIDTQGGELKEALGKIFNVNTSECSGSSLWPFISCAARCSHPVTEIKPPLFRLSNPLYCCSYDSLVHTAAGLSGQGTAQWILSSSRSLWVGERCNTLSRIRRREWNRRSWSACGSHL